MSQIFYLQADYGLQVTHEWNNKINESFIGTDYCNAQWLHPITKINFSQAWFDQNRYDYLVNFYAVVHGNRDIFLVEDPTDYQVTHLPLDNHGIITQGVVVEIDGQFQLCKQYRWGSFYVNRPITRPSQVILYDSEANIKSNYSVDVNTGIITNGGSLGDTWFGTFRIPMRFENDTLPIELQGYDEVENIPTYSLPDLRMTEEKEGLVRTSLSLSSTYNHYLSIPTQIGTQYENKSKTDIFTAESGYSSRDSLNTYRINVTFPSFTATEWDVNYLIGLERLLIGEYANFKYADNNADIDNRFRLLNPISFTTLVDDSDVKLFSVNQLNFIQDDTYKKSTYCHIWRIICRDNDERWFTNHDEMLNISDNAVSPVEAPNATSASKTQDLKTDSTELTSVFGVQVTESDLLNGKYYYAEVQVSLYDWLAQTIVSRLFTGNLGGNTIGYLADKAKNYQFEAVSLTNRLDSSQNVQTSSLCRHKFLSVGYGNCNLTPLGRLDPLYENAVCDKTVETCNNYGNIQNFGGQPRLPGIDETVSRNE